MHQMKLGMASKPSVSLESGLLITGEALNRGSRFLLMVLIARAVGAEEFGAWVIAVAIATFVAGVGDAGIGTIVTRALATAGPARTGQYVRAVRQYLPRIGLGASLLVALASIALGATSHAWLILLLGGGAVLEVCGVFVLSVHRGLNHLRQEGLVRAIEALVFLVGGGFVMLTLDGAVEAMAIVYLVGGAVFLLGAWVQFQLQLGSTVSAQETEEPNSILKAAVPILLANLTFFFYLRADAFLLSVLGGPEATGLYGAAYNFLFGAIFIPYAIARGLMSRFAECSSMVVLRSMYAKVSLAFLAFLLAQALALLLVKPLFHYIYGPGYEAADSPYVLLLCAYVFTGITSLNYFVLVARGRAVAALGAVASGLGVNVLANVVLIPEFGPSGAATAMILSECVLLLIQLWVIKSLLKKAQPVSMKSTSSLQSSDDASLPLVS